MKSSVALREPQAADEIGIVETLVHRFARNPLSILLLCETSWELFRANAVEGGICYFRAHGTAVVWSDPLCAGKDVGATLCEFRAAMNEAGLRTCFLAIGEDTARESLGRHSAVLKVGEEPVFDLRTWKRPRGDRGKRLRWSLNKAEKEGIEVTRYTPAEARQPRLEAEIRSVLAQWQSSLGRESTSTILRTAPLENAQCKQIFLARRAGRLEAVLACSPVYGRNGWYLEDLIRLPESPHGTTELLTVAALESLAAQGFEYASLGIAPLHGFEEQIDSRARWLVAALRLVFDRLDARFHFKALSTYKSKFGPTSWEPSYVAISPAWPSMRLIRAVLAVLDAPGEAPRTRASSAIAAATQVPVLARVGALGLASVSLWQRLSLGGSLGTAFTGVGVAVLLWVVGGLFSEV
ncbi:MAG TPA: DUF2156 domain-containing protein [Candidatus Binatia bacterium]|jgi:lysylphosphatidylglycerol synthetase-like protein (DUF2156 family)